MMLGVPSYRRKSSRTFRRYSHRSNRHMETPLVSGMEPILGQPLNDRTHTLPERK